jgi:hypothetical protein
MAEFKLGRIKFVYQGPWAQNNVYVVDDVVSIGGKAYICVVSHTSTNASTGFSTDLAFVPTKWNILSDGSSWLGTWTNNTYYSQGDQVQYGGVVYQALTAHTSVATSAPVTITGASGTGSVVTITFAAQVVQPFLIGSSITVAGITTSASGYNATATVTACTTTSVSYSNATTASYTSGGTIVGTLQTGLEADQSKWTAYAANLNWIGAWTTNTRYKVRDLVTYGGYVYIVNTAHVSANTTTLGLEADQSKWDIFNSGIIYRDQWSASSVRYRVNDVVTYGADLWICTAQHTSSTTFDEAKFSVFVNGFQFENSWSTSTVYQLGDMVTYGGYTYTAVQNNTGRVPSTATAYWQPFTTGMTFQGEWSASTAYKIGSVVRVGGYTYLAALDNAVQLVQPSTTYVSTHPTRPNQIELPTIATTAASATGGTATITFTQTLAGNMFVVGQQIVVAGVTPIVFNGTWTVTGYSSGSVQFALAGTYGPQTVAGTVSGTTAGLVIGLPIAFSGSTLGGIQIGTTYYVNTIPDSTHFTIAASAANVGVTPFALTAGTSNSAGNGITGTTSPKPPFATYWSQLNAGLRWNPTVNTYSAVSGTNIVGSGTGATFNIVAKNTVYVVTVNAGGTGYASTNTIKILGSSLGGISPANDLTITVNSVSGGVIQSGGVSVSGISASWASGVTYVAGDVVTWGISSFISILAHVSQSGNRPDNDSTGTYWNLLASGAESAVLTTTGDMFYYGGNGPTRLPIGTDGQVLRVVSNQPAWQYYGQINNIVYVSPTGTDTTDGSQGTTIDKPWLTVRYACKQVEDGYLNPNTKKLLALNKQFIIKEVANYVTYTYQAAITGTSSTAFTTADTSGLNVGMPITFTAQTGSLLLSSAAFTSSTVYYIRSIVANTSFTVASTYGGTALAASGSGTATIKYYTSLPTEVERDAEYALEGLIFDISHGGTLKTTTNTLAYFNSSNIYGTAGNSFVNTAVKQQITQFIGAHTYLKTVIGYVLAKATPPNNYQVLNGVSSGARGIQNTDSTVTVESGMTAAVTSLASIISNALTLGYTTQVPAVINPQTTISVKTGTFNEILPIVLPAYTAIVGDELRSTVIQPAKAIANLVNDKPKSINSLKRIKAILPNLLTNQSVTVTSSGPTPNTKSQVTSLPVGSVGSTLAISRVTENCDLMYDIINNGISSVPGIPPSTVLTVTGASGTGTIATLTFASQTSNPYQVGQNIWVYGISPTGYNGYFTVTASTRTSVSFANTTSSAFVSNGTVSSLAQQFKLNTVPGYNSSVLVGYGDALGQVIQNYQFIKDEISAYLNTNYNAVWTALGGTGQALCQRDIGYLLDALQFDMSYGGNVQSLIVGASYYSNYLLTIAATEKAATIAAYTRLKSVVSDIITKTSVTPSAGNATSQVVTGPAGSAGSATFAQARVQDTIDWITNGYTPTALYPSAAIALTASSLQSAYTALTTARAEIQSDTVVFVKKFYQSLNFNATTCSRDTGLIVDALAYDLVFGSNFCSITVGRSYNRAIASVTIVRTSQLAAELDAVAFIKYKARHIAGSGSVAQTINAIDDVIAFINGGSVPERFTIPLGATGTNYQNAGKLLFRNKAFIQAEISAYLAANYSSVWTDIVQETCVRDLGYIIDALRYDLTYGGNWATLKAGKAYYSYVTGSELIGSYEQTATLAAMTQLSTLAQLVINNTGTYTQLQTTVPREFGVLSSATQVTAVAALVTLISDIITNGNAPLTSIGTGVTITTVASNVFTTGAVHGLSINDAVIIPGSATGSIAGLTFTAASAVVGKLSVGQKLSGTGILEGTYITALGTGAGGVGTYVINKSQTVSSTTITGVGIPYYVLTTPTTSTFTVSASFSGAQLTGFTNGSGLTVATEIIKNPNTSNATTATLSSQSTLSAARTTISTSVISYISTTYPDFTYNQALCFRDIGYVLDAVGYDMMLASDFQIVKSAMSYYQAQAGVVTAAQKTQTLAAFNYLATLIATALYTTPTQAALAQASMTKFIAILTNGVGTTPDVHGSITYNNVVGTINGAEILRANAEFLAYEAVAYTGATYGGTVNKTEQTTASATAGTVAGYAFTAGGSVTGTFTIGMVLSGSGITPGTYITASTSSTAFTVNTYQTVSSTTIAGANNVFTVGASHKLSVGDPVQFTSATYVSRTITVVNSSTSGNNLPVGSTTNLVVGMKITISGTAIGALTAGTYFVQSVNSGASTITVTTSYGGSVLALAGGLSGTMALTSFTQDGSFGEIQLNKQYFVLAVPSTSTLVLTATQYSTTPLTVSTSEGAMTLQYYYNTAKCIRDTTEFVNAFVYDLNYNSNYKALRAATLYNNAVSGSISENMFLVRNGTGIRNCTMTGLTGYLSNANAYGTKRPTAGAYASLDPGFGPNDTSVWINTRSCYTQNCTMFGYACVGAKVDGALHAGGNRSMVANDYTTIIGDGIGYWVTGSNAVAELVSVFNYYGYAGYLAEFGARIRATNGNSSYGTYGTIAEGVDTYEEPITATLNNRYFQSYITNVVTDATNQILRFEYNNAGQNYTNTTHSISGSGYSAVAIADEFRDSSVFQTRLIDLNDGLGKGGTSYVTASNVSQTGDAVSITVAATDTALSSAYVGMRVQLTAGTGVGQFANILSYSNGSKIALVNKDSFTTLTVTGTTTTVLQVASTATLYLNMPIYLGATTGVALSANTLYYVKTIPDATTFTVSLTSGGAAITGLTATSTQTISLYAAGFDHVIPGTAIVSALDLTTGYLIEPRISYTGPGYTATARSLIGTATWSSITYGAGYFVAIASGSNNSSYSVDGTSFVAAGALPNTNNWNSVVYAGGQGANASVTVGGLGGTGAILTATIGTGLLTTQIVSIAVTNGGFNYTTAPTLVVTGGGGSGCTATCTVKDGAITTVTVIISGSGYSSLPTISVVTSSVTAVTIGNWGKNYFSNPQVTVSQPQGLSPTSWAVTTAVSSGAYLQTTAGRIYRVTTSGTTGSAAPTTDYTSATTTGIADGTAVLSYIATQTQLTPSLTNAGVSTLAITVAGYGYTAVPNVTILDTTARFVAIANATATAYNTVSSIASAWSTSASSPAAGALPAANFASLAYGNGVLVAVGGAAGTGTAASSGDSGTTWITRTPTALSGGSYSAVTYGNGTFVAINTGGTVSSYSTNGLAWSAGGVLPASTTWSAIAYGNGRFVALAATGRIAYSVDKALNWITAPSATGATTSILSSSLTWSAITYSQGLFFAIAKTTATCATSPDGINWTIRAMPSSSAWQAITAGTINSTTLGPQNSFVAISATSGTIAASIKTGATTVGRMKAQTVTKTIGGISATTNEINEVRLIEPGSGYPKGNVTATTVTTNLITADTTVNLTDLQPIEFTGLDSYGLVSNTTYFVIGATITSTQFKVASTAINAGTGTAITLSTGASLTGVYRAGPIATQFDSNRVNTAPLRVRLADGVLANPSFSNRGVNNATATASTLGDGFADIFQDSAYINISNMYSIPSAGANVTFASITGTSQWYKLVALTNILGTAGNYTAQFQVNPALSTLLAPVHSTLITTRLKYSQVRLTGHDFLYIGTGNQTQTNYPFVVPANAIQANQQNSSGGGRVFFTSTDQDGNFNVGGLFGVQQSTGTATLNASAFNLAGLQSLQLGAVSLGVGSATITQFSTDPYFTANSDNVVPTQKAIKSYITAQIGGGSSSLNVNTLTAGQLLLANNTISNTTGNQIIVSSKMNFTGGIDGAPVALVFFGQR